MYEVSTKKVVTYELVGFSIYEVAEFSVSGNAQIESRYRNPETGHEIKTFLDLPAYVTSTELKKLGLITDSD
ncbi:MAG: hypothetical protein HY513_02255 [Candidatus Aenigmarchaeota archaeon]|nr:hypothetical protein [Candidatus Aenigmarchaeota archaeon]